MTLVHENDEHVLRGYLAQIDFFFFFFFAGTTQRGRTADSENGCAAPFPERGPDSAGFSGYRTVYSDAVLCEMGDVRRFRRPTALMAYLGLVPSQRSSGATLRCAAVSQRPAMYMHAKHVSAQPGNTPVLPESA